MSRAEAVRTMVIVDVVLVAVLVLVVAIQGFGGGGGGSVAAGTTTAGGGAPTTAGASVSSGEPSGESSDGPSGATAGAPGGPSPSPTPGPDRFVTPSGNIACVLADGAATCEILSATFAEPSVAECPGAGRSVILDATGVQVVCPTILATDPFTAGPVELSYGAKATRGEITCTSGTNGVTCTRDDGTGFRLARASLTFLPS
jgi:hypothetical protein